MNTFVRYMLAMGGGSIVFAAGSAAFIYVGAAVAAGAFIVAGLAGEVTWPVNLTLAHVNQFAAVIAYVFALFGLVAGFFVCDAGKDNQ